jgi:hypothetical protein
MYFLDSSSTGDVMSELTQRAGNPLSPQTKALQTTLENWLTLTVEQQFSNFNWAWEAPGSYVEMWSAGTQLWSCGRSEVGPISNEFPGEAEA